MKKSFAKRALALVLSTIMLASCWLFTAPTTSVAAGASEYAYRIEHQDANPVYHVEIDMHILDAGNGFNRVFKGTQTGNPDGGIWDDKDYKDMGGIVIWYKDNNGTAASEIDYSIDFSPTNAKIAYYHSDGSQVTNNTMFPNSDSGSRDNWDDKYYTLCLDLSGFPTAYAVYNNNDHMKFSWGWKPDTWTDFEITQIRVSGYDSSVDVTSEAYPAYRPIFTGNIRSASTDGANCSRYYIQQDGTVSIWRPNEFGSNFEGNTDNNWVHFSDFADGQDAMKTGGSFNAAYSKSWDMPYPELADYSYTRLSGENNYYPAPEHAVLTAPYVFGKDQYGAQLAGTVTSSFVCLGEKYYDGSAWQNASFGEPSYAFNNQTAELTPLKANGYQYHQFSIRPQTEWVIGGQYINVNGATNGMYYGNTKAALMNYTPQTITWQHYTDNSAGNTGTLQQPTTEVFYGDTPAARTDLPTAYYDNASHHSGGSFTTGPVTEDTTYTMQYAVNEEHTISYSELSNTDEEYHSKHLAICTAGCGYTNKVDHTYDATSFSFAADGKSADVSRQCTVNGCKHTQSGSVSLDGGGITSAVKTPATCLTVGTTTYTATSPFGDGATDTKDVDDIAALDHDWTATRFTFATDGKTATAYRDCKRDASHNQSQGAVVTSEVITPATCTAPGTTRYTATSTFSGDSATDYVDKEDIPALGHNTTGEGWQTSAEQHWKNCINGCGVKQELADHDWNTWQDNGDGTHFRSCKVCGYRAGESHSGYTFETTAPTCTAQGYTTYTCPTCNYSYVDNYTTALGHDASGTYQSDGSNHWKVCQRAGCGADIYDNNGTWTAGRTGHVWEEEGTVTKEPTCTETGILTKKCTVCHSDEHVSTSTIPARGHDYTKDTKRDNETEKTPATCTTDGEYFYTCSRCDDISNSIYYTAAEGTTGYRLGHDYRQTTYTPKDSSPGFEYFKCSRCAVMREADYNSQTDTYEVDTSKTTEYSGANALDRLANDVINDDTNTSKVPSANFNDFTDPTIPQGDGGYSYADRGAGLRLMKTASGQPDTSFDADKRTPQDMRFSGAASVPAGLDVAINPAYYNYTQAQLIEAGVDNAVVDFGFVYSQETYVYDHYTNGFADMTIENSAADAKLARMSVPAQNAAKGTFNKNTNNWDGVTYHVHNQGNESDNDQFTFNLVIQIRAKNWKYYYIGRPYMRYMYRGKLYTVYDNCASNGGEEGGYPSSNLVYGIADEMVKYSDPLAWYAQAKIIDHNADIPAGDIP